MFHQESAISLVFVIALAFSLFLFEVLARRIPSWMLLTGFTVIPIGLTPLWVSSHSWGIFEWAKLYTIILTAIGLVLFRGHDATRFRWMGSALKYLFALNILEASLVDFSSGAVPGVMNGLAGVLLVLTLPKKEPYVLTNGLYREVRFPGFRRTWLTSFTVWNLCFLYMNYTLIFGHHLIVLGVTLAIGWGETGRWLQARILLLTIDLVALATFSTSLIAFFDTAGWYNPDIGRVLAFVSLTLSLWAVLVPYLSGGSKQTETSSS